jgi:hypothetical protein
MARSRAPVCASLRRWIGVVGLGLLHALLVVTAVEHDGKRADPYERPYVLTYTVGHAAVVRPAPHVQPVRACGPAVPSIPPCAALASPQRTLQPRPATRVHERSGCTPVRTAPWRH